MPASRSRCAMTTGFHRGAWPRPEIGADTESVGECRIGAVAPMSDNAHGLRQSVSRAVATTLIDPPQVGASVARSAGSCNRRRLAEPKPDQRNNLALCADASSSTDRETGRISHRS
jgi:hypothetical protein